MDNGEVPDVSVIKESVKEIKREKGQYDWRDLTDINSEVILKKLKSLIEFEAFGVDKISNAVLKNCAESFAKRVTNLLETLDIITDAVNKGHSVDLILLDFAKAFDKVSHVKLIQKLEAYGLNSI